MSHPDAAPATEPAETQTERASTEPTVDEFQQALAEQRRLAEERWDLYLRARAELDNQRKRFAKELEQTRKHAIADLLRSMLQVRDTLELALAAAGVSDVAALIQGLRLTLKSFDSELEARGVEEVPASGECFDPEIHEALAVEPSDMHPPNTVLQVHRKGYLLNGRLVRAAQVTVSSAGDEPRAGGDDNSQGLNWPGVRTG